MIIIRLIRIGKKNSSSFRLVLTDKKNPPRGGRFLEILGNYNPRKKESNLKKERINYWLSQGAKASDTVHNLLINQGVIKGPKIKKKIKIKKKAEEAKKEEIGKEAAKEEVKEKPAEKTEEVKEEPVEEQNKPKEEEPVAKKEEKTPDIDKSEKEK
jgi:small subunit ribosomal protein S16